MQWTTQGGTKTDTLVNYVNVTPYKQQHIIHIDIVWTISTFANDCSQSERAQLFENIFTILSEPFIHMQIVNQTATIIS